MSRDGRTPGSVSGGCLESAVVLEAQVMLEGDAPPRLLHYGISDELGWSVGLACGRTVDIFVEKVGGDGTDPVLAADRCGQRCTATRVAVAGDGVESAHASRAL